MTASISNSGACSRAWRNSKEDRAQLRSDFKDALSGQAAALSGLGGDVRNLAQIVHSTASQVSSLVSQDLGGKILMLEAAVKANQTRLERIDGQRYDQRLGAVESKLGRYDRDECDQRLRVLKSDSRFHNAIIGAGIGFATRLAALIGGAGAVAAVLMKALHWATTQ